MSTLVVSAVDNESKADCTLVDLGPVWAGAREIGPGAEEAPGIWVGGPLYRLAKYISGLLGRLFPSLAYDSEPLEEPDSDYPGCWSCCL